MLRVAKPAHLLAIVPALRALRSKAPDAHITLVAPPGAADFVARFRGYVDALEEVPPLHAISDSATAVKGSAGRALRYDLAIQLQPPDPYADALLAGLGAGFNAGFHMPNEPRRLLDTSIPWPEQGPEVLRLLMLIRAVGATAQGDALEYPILASDRAELERCADALALVGGPFVCIQPGARAPERRWQASRFANVADALVMHGLRVALTGTEADRPVAEAVRSRMRGRAIDVTGCLTVGAFALLLDYAFLFVCNDTGVTRLAEAVGVPSVIVASGQDVPLWRPADRGRYRVLWQPAPRRPSMERLWSDRAEHGTGTTPEDVLAACDQLLAESALKERATVRARVARLRHESRLVRQLTATPHVASADEERWAS
ncbi:MAG: glycosyltransferase family 9 protein [Gemmatimonadaceae bacterium]